MLQTGVGFEGGEMAGWADVGRPPNRVRPILKVVHPQGLELTRVGRRHVEPKPGNQG